MSAPAAPGRSSKHSDTLLAESEVSQGDDHDAHMLGTRQTIGNAAV
jgi:hypothetical protein